MAKNDWRQEFDEFMDLYNQGLYSQLERYFFCQSLLFEFQNEDVWWAFNDAVRNKMIDNFRDISEESDIAYLSGSGDPAQAKREMFEMKAWLIEKGFL